ncbi:carboxylesterase/lipase family protein [Rhodococcus globerulus]|uniref:carboxylesterase/lipase family protein n=1 Tax=Rhodococcus TaxID=1827 RepID=UPI00121A800F|nr:carboxylesterase/lipase family protein [Rhodococcus sp. (in: high G+C Gram-positive bacteria)]RZL27228.1 MAG: carboxylesterase/lipase family protein [Rhodococcus sp. (in: high G+C Gram-positive bacteria)]
MAADAPTNPGLLVRTADGTLRGTRVGKLRAWRGIPYARPPVGALRLQAPRPVRPWRGERNASAFGDASVQNKKGLALAPGKYQPSSEDCLTLNVLAPEYPSREPLPVMVFIHGGANTIGTSATGIYSGRSLVTRGNIVYVSINYRLGALGFLDFTEFSTPRHHFDANLGLRDQVAALQWVQRNIAAFGGDPDRVTVFGESAGGTAVTTLLATPAAKGLFAAAIAESPAPDLVANQSLSREWGRRFIDILGSDATPDQALRLTSARELGRAGARLGAEALAATPGLHPFGPSVDGDFLPHPPAEACSRGLAHRVPLIIGTNKREGTLFPKFLDGLPTTPARIERMFALTDPAAGNRILATYPGYPSTDTAIDIGGDVTFWHPSVELAQAHAQYAPTYAYRFDFAPPLMRWVGLDATHGFEMFAVFGIGDSAVGRGLTVPGGRRGLSAVTEAMQGHWLHFAQHAAPRSDWPSYAAQRHTMIFDAISRVDTDPRAEQRRAWSGYAGYRNYAPNQVSS